MKITKSELRTIIKEEIVNERENQIKFADYKSYVDNFNSLMKKVHSALKSKYSGIKLETSKDPFDYMVELPSDEERKMMDIHPPSHKFYRDSDGGNNWDVLELSAELPYFETTYYENYSMVAYKSKRVPSTGIINKFRDKLRAKPNRGKLETKKFGSGNVVVGTGLFFDANKAFADIMKVADKVFG